MEDELFRTIYRIVYSLPNAVRRTRQQYSDADILLVYFWAVLHDRPTSWACRSRCWPKNKRWRLPSESRVSRRLRYDHMTALMHEIEAKLRPNAEPPMCKTIDAKPLPIGGYSKDKDAKVGYATRNQAKGYKLFTICDIYGIAQWEVHAMNKAEQTVARSLIPQLDGGGYLLGDSAYDSNSLYELTGFCNHQLVAPRKQPGTGLGAREHSPLRLRSVAMMEPPRMPGAKVHFFVGMGKHLYKQRTSIERVFGHMGNFDCGLKPLPNWVRTLPRVRRWVHAKIIINAVRLLNLQKQRVPA